MREFSGNANVVFGDVNLQDAGNIPGKFGAGQGGWPTVRYFNAETGYDGAPYKQKTSKSMCDELGDMEYAARPQHTRARARYTRHTGRRRAAPARHDVSRHEVVVLRHAREPEVTDLRGQTTDW